MFIDIDEFYLFDLSRAINSITNKTVAIITVDLYGQTLDNQKVREFCNTHNLYFIQDCAHSPGAKYNGYSVSRFSDLACWSFYPGKNLDCMGDGGAVTGNTNLINKVQYLKDHARTKRYTHTSIGWSSRLDGIQAAILIEKLKLLDAENQLRRMHAKFYDNALTKLPVVLPKSNVHSYHVYHQYVIQTNRRDELLEYARINDIILGIHYPVPCHLQPVYNTNQTLAVSENIAETCISLPVHPYLLAQEQEYIVNTLNKFFN